MFSNPVNEQVKEEEIVCQRNVAAFSYCSKVLCYLQTIYSKKYWSKPIEDTLPFVPLVINLKLYTSLKSSSVKLVVRNWFEI